MRRCEDGLNHLCGALALQGVDHQGDDDGQREADQEAFDTQQEGVLHQCPELDIREESGEVFESDPNGVLGEDIVTGHEILEGDQNTIDGQVVEQEYDEYGRKQENQERIISLHVLAPDLELGLLGQEGLLRRDFRGCGGFFHFHPPLFFDFLLRKRYFAR